MAAHLGVGREVRRKNRRRRVSEAGAWMPLYIGDYLADTMHLGGAEHGAYLLLIMHYWRNGPLPDDDRMLAAIARTERKEWMSGVGSVVRQFFSLEDSRLHHKRIDSELARAMQNSSKRRDAANARWQQARCKTDANASDVQSERNDPRAQSPSPSPEEKKETDLRSVPKENRSANGARLPEDWNPDAEGAQFARDLGLDPARTFDRFRDYWRGQPGAKGRKLDWIATWRNWCRKEADDRGVLPLAPPPQSGHRLATPMSGGL